MEIKKEEKNPMLWDGLIEGIPLFAKELIAGGVAGGIAKTSVAPLERIKILFQTRQAEFQIVGLRGSFAKIAKTEGLQGFYRGNGASVARIVPYAALHYMAYEEYRRWIIHGIPSLGRGPVLDLVAGSFAGATAVLFTYPLDLVRTKLAYQVVGSLKSNPNGVIPSEKVYKGIFDCFSKTFREARFRGLYRGVGKTFITPLSRGIYVFPLLTCAFDATAPSLYGIFPYAGLKFYFYEKMKSNVPEEHKADIAIKLACGSLAGLLGQTLTYPLDVVRRQMQVQHLSASNTGDTRGTIDTLASIIRKQGWKQLFSGLSLNYLKVVPSVAIGFTVYDAMKLYLRVPSRDDEVIINANTNQRNSEPSSLHS